jgi:ABC-type antimicrobial peptide transport system permease subunit
VYILGSIALFTLLIACVNFMNLSTAGSVKRAAEVGIRKVLGAERGALVRQFLGESVVLSAGALVVSLLLIALLLPFFNHLSGVPLGMAALFDPPVIAAFAGLTLLTGLLAGSYPAPFLSGFQPSQVLKGKFVNSLSAVTLRKGLVVFQFFIAVCLMLSTFIIGEQMQYLRNKPLGFAKDQQVVIPLRTDEAKRAYPAFRNEVLVNEAVLKQFGIPPDRAIGYTLHAEWRDSLYRYDIVGVVKNFHFKSLHRPIEPYLFYLSADPRFNYLIANVDAGRLGEVLPFMANRWKAVRPDEPFEYSFLDEDFGKNYRAEEKGASLVRVFTVTAILISCLGLFGLAAFATQQRTKEIGIRKVLGASVPSLVALLSGEFLRLVAVAILVASPVAWYAMNRWLEDFAYRIEVPWWVFGATGLLALGIAFFTVSFQAVKAALRNPVKSLRTE